MSINLYWGGKINNKHKRYSQLTHLQKQFLIPEDIVSHSSLILWLLSADISLITESSIPIISERVNALLGKTHTDAVAIVVMGKPMATCIDVLKLYEGVSINLTSLSRKDWAAKYFQECDAKQIRFFKTEHDLWVKNNATQD
jgi:hypothetical protein